MTRRISIGERRASLARRHRLLPSLHTDDITVIADDLVALHSTDPVTVFLSAMVRMVNPSVQAVEKALYDDRVVVRHHAMRRTLWVATPPNVRRMHAAATRSIAATEHARAVKMLQENGIDDAEAWFTAAKRDVLEILRAEGPMTARQLGTRVPALAHPLQLAPGKSYASTQAAHTRVLLVLGFEGALVRTRPVGTFVNGQYTWAAMDDWMPGGVGNVDKRDAARDLADQWLRGFGPGTTLDLRWWMGWAVATTRQALADCGAVPVELDSGPAWVAAGDEDPVDPVEPWVEVLPGLDPTTMGWKERAWYLPDEAADAFDSTGNGGPTIWVDGQVVGAWARLPDGEIRTHYFVPVAKKRRAQVDRRLEEVQAWLGPARFTVRFPGNIHAQLVS